MQKGVERGIRVQLQKFESLCKKEHTSGLLQ